MSDAKLDDMTMRDLFALFAMQGILTRNKNVDLTLNEVEIVALDSYTMADAMLKVRSGNETYHT